MVIAGLGMVIGNFLGAKMAEWFSPMKAIIISLSTMVTVLLINSAIAANPIAVLVMTFIIGIISFSVSTPLQMAIIRSAKGAEMFGSSMNQSAFNMGNASGAYLAGLPIAMGFSFTSAGVVGAVLAGCGVLIAIGVLVHRKRAEIKRNKCLSYQS